MPWNPYDHPRYPENGEFAPKGQGEVIIGRQDHSVEERTPREIFHELGVTESPDFMQILYAPKFPLPSEREKFVALGLRHEASVRRLWSVRLADAAAVEEEAKRTAALYPSDNSPAAPEVHSGLEGLLHFLDGSGTPRSVPFENIDTSSVRPSQFNAVKEALSGPPRDAVIPIDARMPFEARKDYQDLLGTLTLRLKGTLQLTKTGSWNFKGTLKSYDDLYDMNKSTHRAKDKELATTMGRVLGQVTNGRDYRIEVRGGKSIQESGTLKNAILFVQPPAAAWQKPLPTRPLTNRPMPTNKTPSRATAQ